MNYIETVNWLFDQLPVYQIDGVFKYTPGPAPFNESAVTVVSIFNGSLLGKSFMQLLKFVV